MRCLLLAIVVLFSTNAFSQKIDVFKRPKQAEKTRDYDALHYKIQLRFDEDNARFYGKCTISVSPLRDQFDRCELDAEVLKVTEATTVDGKPLRFTQSDSAVTVFLSRAYSYQDSLSFTLHYESDNPALDPKRYGMGSNYDLGLDFKEKTPDNPQLINTLSFPEGARHWFPCNDVPGDKATQETIAIVKSSYKALSNGRLVSVSENPKNGTSTYHWKQELPHSTYLFAFVAGPYTVIEDSLGSLPVNYWVYPQDVENAHRSFHKTPEILAFFNKEYGFDYPWIKYDQITIPGIGGGAESTTATVLGQSTIHDARADQDFPSHWLIAHEAAHQWWGDLVTMRTWSQAWINESFATYGEYLFSKHDLGDDEGAINLLKKKNQYLNEAHNKYIRPMVLEHYVYPNNVFDSHLYPKGATILNMLQWIMGDAPFRRAISHFLHKHAFQAVETGQLMTAIKEATGQNMDWFFRQWIYKSGHPVFDVSYIWEKETQEIVLKIAQKQELSEQVPIYKTPVVIGVTTADGTTNKKIWITRKEENIRLKCTEKPLLVRFDVGNYLLKEWTFEKSEDELLYQLKNDDAIGRMWAASQLKSKLESRNVIDALKHSAETDSFWAVRRDAILALSAKNESALFAFFKERVSDKKSGVRVAAIKALATFADPDMIDYLTTVYKKDDSYLVQAAAIRALGTVRNQNVDAVLKAALEVKSPRSVIKRAAEAALSEKK